eukprot:243826-Chlamydomonas_euryale.AAC.1
MPRSFLGPTAEGSGSEGSSGGGGCGSAAEDDDAALARRLQLEEEQAYAHASPHGAYTGGG